MPAAIRGHTGSWPVIRAAYKVGGTKYFDKREPNSSKDCRRFSANTETLDLFLRLDRKKPLSREEERELARRLGLSDHYWTCQSVLDRSSGPCHPPQYLAHRHWHECRVVRQHCSRRSRLALLWARRTRRRKRRKHRIHRQRLWPMRPVSRRIIETEGLRVLELAVARPRPISR